MKGQREIQGQIQQTIQRQKHKLKLKKCRKNENELGIKFVATYK